ncbi:MAG: aminopeptidase P family protein [Bacteroidota bacterium]
MAEVPTAASGTVASGSLHAPRLARLRALLAERGTDALLLTALHDLRWAVGFTGSNGALLVTAAATHFVTDGRYDEQARREVSDAEVHIASGNLHAHVAEQGWIADGATVTVQSDHLTVAAFGGLRKRFERVEFDPVAHLLDAIVAEKSPEEIAQVRAAQAVTDAVFEAILPRIRPGITERDLAAEITVEHLRRGASAMAFDPIVASGPNSALPHARPTDRMFQRGDIVLIDMGAYLDGYASDMTRTAVIGPASDEQRTVYDAVLRAQETAIEAAHAGMTGKDLDGVARTVLTEAGYGAQFSHSLGHGVGLQVHAWPRLSQQVEHVLPVGATVTIEPGVYLAGRFGVRIEDIIALREDGCDNLTRTPKALLEL